MSDCPFPISFVQWGLWNIHEIEVTVYSKNYVQILYEKFELNSSKNIINVFLNPIDKLKGITIEEKAKKRLIQLKEKLELDNKRIKELREMKKRITN